jgi:hypothetical protein
MAMIRKQVYIAPRQDKILKRLARQTLKTEAEIIRCALEESSAIFARSKHKPKIPLAQHGGLTLVRPDVYIAYAAHDRCGVSVM